MIFSEKPKKGNPESRKPSSAEDLADRARVIGIGSVARRHTEVEEYVPTDNELPTSAADIRALRERHEREGSERLHEEFLSNLAEIGESGLVQIGSDGTVDSGMVANYILGKLELYSSTTPNIAASDLSDLARRIGEFKSATSLSRDRDRAVAASQPEVVRRLLKNLANIGNID